MEEMDAVKMLERLKDERVVLLQDTKLCQEGLENTANLVQETKQMISLLQTTIQVIEGKQATAEGKWLTYWGIEEPTDG